MARYVAVIVAAYLLGSVPFAYIITRTLTGRDVRLTGEGNVGTRNAMHTAGLAAGLFTFLLDAAKGAMAYWVGRHWVGNHLAIYLAGIGLMLGHGFPIWLGWHGGKGLAAASGFLAQIWPHSVLVAYVVLLVSRLFLREFDLAAALSAVTFFSLSFWEGNDPWGIALIVLLLGGAGVKRLLDLPQERALLAKNAPAKVSDPGLAAPNPNGPEPMRPRTS